MIIEEYDESLFIQRFENHNRVISDKNRNGNFSYSGLRALYEYLDEAYDEENPFKMDVISLCCDFVEYNNLVEFEKDYTIVTDKAEYEENQEGYMEAVENEISDSTCLIKIGEDLSEGFIIQSY